MSLISSVVRVCWLRGFVDQREEDAVKMAAHGLFLLINLEGGVRAWGWEAKNKPWRRAMRLTLITAYDVLDIVSIALCGAHIYAELIAQEVE